MSGSGPEITVVTSVDGADGMLETAALIACSKSSDDVVGLLVCFSDGKPPEPTVFSAGAAKDAEAGLRAAGFDASARGAICVASIIEDEAWLDRLICLMEAGEGVRPVVAIPPHHYSELVNCDSVAVGSIVFRADRPGDETPPLLGLATDEAREVCETVTVADERPGWLKGRRALAGAISGTRALEVPESKSGKPSRLRGLLFRDRGQATPMVLGAVFVLVLGTVLLVAVGGAVTGKARAQRAVDLSALSAARSMKTDLPRLLAPPTLPNGMPNPAHMPKPVYLLRARLAAVRIATANGAAPWSVAVRFPDAISYAPVRVRVAVRARVKGGRPSLTESWAEARVSVPLGMGSVPSIATGGGYSGPLAERQGEGMRPDVAAAFDRMTAAAAAAGVTVTVTSAFRSDAEQAALFAANPDPTWVARPGTSLHRCATELDLGPSSAYGWLAANASRFGFEQRYSWESWHYGFVAGPEPCSAAGNHVLSGGDPKQALTDALPGFVPARFRKAILASAMKWNVSAALLAAQLYAESGFDPDAGSPAGAQGIAQFMPATAASYGLSNPFDPDEAIDAQGHLMSDLLKQFGSPALALAAYNAGPGAVSGCNCIPSYPETQAYVAKILGLLGGVGAIAPMPMEIELVR